MARLRAKTRLFDQLSRTAVALGSGRRLELLDLLRQRDRGVDELARMTGQSVANASRHLQWLRREGLIVPSKVGQRVFYRIAGDEVERLMLALEACAGRHSRALDALASSYLKERDALDPVPVDQVLQRARNGLVTVLDVRPPEEYAAGHVPGAINIPFPEIARRLRELPARKEVIAYCRGPYCLMAYDAVALLRRRGRKARRLDFSWPEWKLSGLPVATADEGNE